MRTRDSGTYLVARADAAQVDLRNFCVGNGVRNTPPGVVLELPVADTNGHTRELRAKGPELTTSIDGSEAVRSYHTDLLRGRVGLWTQADSATESDDFRVDSR